jgi:hypothetical protein
MNEVIAPITLTTLSLELKSKFAHLVRVFGANLPVGVKRIYVDGILTTLEFLEPGDWPSVSYPEMHRALLALHHAGYIHYGSTVIRLKAKLLEKP